MLQHSCSRCGAAMTTAEPQCGPCRRERRRRLRRVPVKAVQWLRATLVREAAGAAAPVGITGFPVGKSGSDAAPAAILTGIASDQADVTPRSRRLRRPTYLVPLFLLAVIALIVGFYAVRIRETFETVNSISTMAPAISGEALGGSSQITIDTGPAQTALAGGFAASASTHTPESRATIPHATPATQTGAGTTETPAQPTTTVTGFNAPTGTAESPNRNVDQLRAVIIVTLPAEPIVEPTSTAVGEEPTVVLSEIDRVKNGDFERGAADWYVEQGAEVQAGEARGGDYALTIDETGGFASQRIFFVPETTYHLSLWAKLSTASVERATIGVSFLDGNDDRLSDLQPAASIVSGTEWIEIAYSFVAPAQAAAIEIYAWKPSGSAVLLVDDVSVRSVVPPDSPGLEIQESAEGSMTILLMGVDAREGEAIDIGVRPDSLMVLRLNASTGGCRILSIPRDTRTELPGYGMTKVNHALAVGGIEYQIQVVERMLGLAIDHYVLIDFNGFEDLVDAVGGITVDVPAAFTAGDGQHFPAGSQSMTGKQALSYARWRGGPDGDFGRIQRQQQILRALVHRASGLNIVTSINELLPAVEANLRTDLSATQMVSVATEYRSRCTESTISMFRLEGFDAVYPDPMLQMNLYYIEVDRAEVRRKVATLLEG